MSINIPTQYDPKNAPDMAFNAVADNVARLAEFNQETIINLSKSGDAGNAGIMATATGAHVIANRNAEDVKKDKEAKERAELMAYLSMLDDEIEYFDGQIEQANAALGAQEILEQLHEQKLLDPDNPDHQKHFKAAGIDPDEYRKNGGASLAKNRERIEDWRDTSIIERDDAKQRRHADYSNVSEAEILAQTNELEAARKIRENAQTYEDVDRAEDRLSAQIKDEKLIVEVDTQRGYEVSEVVEATSALTDEVSVKVSETTMSAASMFGDTSIDPDINLFGDFNEAAIDKAEVTANNTNEAENIFSQETTNTSESFPPLGQSI